MFYWERTLGEWGQIHHLAAFFFCATLQAMKTRKIPKLNKEQVERFWGRVNIGRKDECWEWGKEWARNKGGYGIIGFFQFPFLAHRIAYSLHYKQTPLGGILVCHHCDNPPCCNPNHLFLGTEESNTRDMIKKGRRVAFLGKKHSAKTKKIMSRNNKGSKHPQARAVNQYTLDGKFIKRWECLVDVEKELKLSHGNIWSVCVGRKKQTGGFVWKYTDMV